MARGWLRRPSGGAEEHNPFVTTLVAGSGWPNAASDLSRDGGCTVQEVGGGAGVGYHSRGRLGQASRCHPC